MLSTVFFDLVTESQNEAYNSWRQCREPIDYLIPALHSTANSVAYFVISLFACIEGAASFAVACGCIIPSLLDDDMDNMLIMSLGNAGLAFYAHSVSIIAIFGSWLEEIPSSGGSSALFDYGALWLERVELLSTRCANALGV